jgi:long-chain acyl-CoA synthetase
MLEWLGPVLFEYFASSEGYGTSITSADWLDGNGAHMKILDDLHNPMPAGEVGTLWIQNPGGLTSEYFGDPDKTAAAHLGTYFTTGDMAYIDQDGWLFIVDRRTDMILSGGVNIYPAEVEDVMRVNAAIDDIAVLGLPDDEWGSARARRGRPVINGRSWRRARSRNPLGDSAFARKVQDPQDA